MLNPVEEIYFWSGIMRDHGEFFILNLSVREQEFAAMANHYKSEFIHLQKDAGMMLRGQVAESVSALVNRALSLVMNFIQFKRTALRRLLQCDIELGLTPTFINHMINEALEFYRALCLTATNAPVNKVQENMQLLAVWLPDAAGHAAGIISELDGTETELIKEAEEFKNSFEHLFIKADELGKMLARACLTNGSLKYMNEQVENKIKEFILYLEKVKKLRMECKALGVIKPLIPDHMIREEKYFLARIRKVEK